MTRKNAEAKTEKDTSSRIPLFAAIITGVFVVGAATVTAGWWSKLIFGSPKTFVVTVRNTASEKPLRGAKIRLESEGVPPIEKLSDSNGSAQFRIDDPKKEVHVWINADGFDKADWQIIPADTGNLNAQLSPIGAASSPSPVPTSTPTLKSPSPTKGGINSARYTANCRAFFGKGEFNAALSQCNKALSINPSDSEALNLKKRIEEAIRILEK